MIMREDKIELDIYAIGFAISPLQKYNNFSNAY